MELPVQSTEWDDELEFTKALAESIRCCSIRSKNQRGMKVTKERLSESREVTSVDVNKSHPYNDDVGRPDLAIYYEGDPLPRLYGRTLSNPFFIECKMSKIQDEILQALRYKWRGGEFKMEKYSGDSVGMTTPAYLNHFERGANSKFRIERYLWHAGIGVFRQGKVEEGDGEVVCPVLAFNEEEHIIFDPHNALSSESYNNNDS